MEKYQNNFGINKNSIFSQILIFFGTTLLCLSVFAGFSQLFLAKIIGADNVAAFIQNPFNNIQFINVFKCTQLVSSIGMFGVSALMFAFLKEKNGFMYLQLTKVPKPITMAFVVPLVLCSLPIIAYVYYYNQQINFGSMNKIVHDLEHQNAEITKAFLSSTTIAGLLFNLLVVAIVPGIVEEIFFRGVLQKLLHEGFRNKHAAIIISAILFSAMHMEFLGFIPRFLMGLMLGYLFDWSKNIWVNIAAHALNNGISVIAYFMFVKGYTSTDIDNMDHYGIAPTAIAVVFFAVLFYLFYKNVNKQPIELSN
ncbi:MAG: hypothetical protein RIQ33_1554 [Bacteroidota bacterium]|jgi:membrane protease YdiL (CAAX protease family)